VPEGLLSVVVGFGMVRVSRSRANWVLISSNCARRIHMFARVSSGFLSVGVMLGNWATLRLMLLSLSCPICFIASLHIVSAGGAGSVRSGCC